MAAEPAVSQDFQDLEEAPRSPKKHYDLTSVQTLYDPGQAQGEIEPKQESRAKAEASYNYKPTALRTWFLALVTAFLLGCVAVTEYALRSEPSASQVFNNATIGLSSRGSPWVEPAKGWLGAALGNNLGPDGKPRAQGLPRMGRGDFRLVERVPGSTAFMPTGFTTRTLRVSAGAPAGSQTREIPTSRTITTERTVLVTITPPVETPKDREPTPTDDSNTGDKASITTTEGSTSLGVHRTTLVDQTTAIPITKIIQVPTTTTDAFGNVFTTLADKTLVSAHTLTTQVVSTLADVEHLHGGTWTTLVDEVTTISAITTRVPVTTTDSSGKLITTSRETTLPARTITTRVVSTVSSDGQSHGNDADADADPDGPALLGGLETQLRFQIDSTAARGPTVLVVASTLAYATVVPTTVPTVVPGGPGDGGGGGPGDGAAELEVLGLTTAQYFAGAFLPTLLAVVASALLEAVGTSAKLVQPFQALASAPPGGRAAESSVFLRFDGWLGALTIPQAVRLGQPLIVATQLAVLGSLFLAPLAAEAVAIYTPDSCTAMCYGRIAVQGRAAWVLEALLGAIAVLLVAVIALTSWRRWRTGVNHNPWSIAGMASLCLNSEVRELMKRIPRGEGSIVADKDILKVLNGRRYMLGDFADPTQHGVRYGLVAVDDDGGANQNQQSLLNAANVEVHGEGEGYHQQAETNSVAGEGFSSWLAPLSWWFRALLLFFVASVMAIVAYYQDSTGNSGFERFMDSRGFGVRFFSTMLGVLLGGLMGALFGCVAVLTPFLRLSQRALPAERSILLSPPTNAFSGLVSAYRQRSPFLGIFSLTTILAKIVLPVTLDHVPFSYNETWLTQQICAWLSIGILAMMIIVVAASFLIRWPNLPVQPSTIAGAMFYVCDSYMLEAFDDLARKSKGERDSDVRAMGAWYAYRQNMGVGEKERAKVDACHWKAE